ncbi:PEP-CTERM sorting domain-containing protein [Aquincola sp. J276]|uniref:PEP-CTERM sorting domain-containing protein n=1 Tax=Aquincola sp. J276 TaxID=2898432 RepID=UPI0021511830|nr:PEP-CTERM sorting domain-containing protein [Aquincola sp. J276]MCR5865196.1 PEP-CTERM sorting domain-containing protein [Aquincola sp. J276]
MTARTLNRAPAAIALLAAGLAALATPARAELYWDFAYSGTGVSASGILVTQDVPDGSGYYLATGILGQRNGSTITGLQPTGTAIPLNDPFEVDNLVRADGRLSSHGLGFATASGEYANLFRASWLSPARTVEFASRPALNGTTEEVVSWQFSARTEPLPAVPEPASAALLLAGVALVGTMAARRRAG